LTTDGSAVLFLYFCQCHTAHSTHLACRYTVRCMNCYSHISMFQSAFFNSIIDKTPTHALFIQHYISLAC